MDETICYVRPPRTSRPVGDSIFSEVYHAIEVRGGAATGAEIATIVAKSGVNDPKTGKPYVRAEVQRCIARMVGDGRLEAQDTLFSKDDVDAEIKNMLKNDSLRRQRDGRRYEEFSKELGRHDARTKRV